jgi:prepilin-type N-terminal cleavage/methylation domain-containing protein
MTGLPCGPRTAFTLIELLVVISIMLIALGMMADTMTRQNREESVRVAAEGLAGTLREARMRAMVRDEPYAVVFHIQNAPGSSGRILNNRSGGHGYRILGPMRGHSASKWGGKRPMPLPYIGDGAFKQENSDPWGPHYNTLPRYIELLQQCWVSPFIPLPGGRVRFLALSETDEGNRINADNQENGTQTSKAWAYAPTYPRPYFGYFDSATGRLFPWGGYDHQLGIDQPWRPISGAATPSTNYTGFFYAGKDGAIVGSMTSAAQARTYLDAPLASIHGSAVATTSYTVLAANTPRPLVNSEWGDAMIVFAPNGNAYFPPFGVARKRYFCIQHVPNSGTNYLRGANGVSDMTRGWVWKDGMTRLSTASAPTPWLSSFDYTQIGGQVPMMQLSDQSEFGHFKEHLGGYHITLAPDSLDDQDAFGSASEALASVSPMMRVYVSTSGAVEVFKVATRDDGWLATQGTLFPTSSGNASAPQFFLGSSSTTSIIDGNPSAHNDARFMGMNFRYGWLHEPLPKGGGSSFTTFNAGSSLYTDGPDMLVPRGRPISYVVTPRMMKDKIWWIQ